ncbi:Uncharacterised protein [Bacillus freudenreichii]|nr:Uncharacterised protein [Bacillus freudenreichii]
MLLQLEEQLLVLEMQHILLLSTPLLDTRNS